MTQDEKRSRIRELLDDRQLPRHLGLLKRVEAGETHDTALVIGPGIGRSCFVCTDESFITYEPKGRDVSFCRDCEELWREERDKPRLRPRKN